MMFMFGLSLKGLGNQHNLIESLLVEETKKKEEPVNLKENINVEDITF